MKRLGLSIFALISLTMLAGCFMPGLRPVPMDVVLTEGDLFFVLEERKEIEGVYVTLHMNPLEAIAEAKKKENKKRMTMWAVEYNLQVKTEKKKYPELEQIRYGQEIGGFTTTEGPFNLEKNVKYHVRIEIYGREFVNEIFYIDDQNKVELLTRKATRTYSLSTDKDGNKTLILGPVSK